MENTINRDAYLNRLIDKKENGLIKVVTGIRRCGKSFLLINQFYDYLIQSLHISLYKLLLNEDSLDL